MLKITADEVNFLIHQYLEETGYKHTAFSFRHESNIDKSALNDSHIPPTMLLMYLEKALLMLQMETHLDKDDEVILCNQPFSLLSPHICNYSRSNIEQNHEEPVIKLSQTSMKDIPQATKPDVQGKQEEKKESKSEKMEDLKPQPVPEESDKKIIRLLEGHKGVVYNVAWHPNKPILASGGGDGTSILWKMTDTNKEINSISIEYQVLPHVNPNPRLAQIDVTSLDWSSKKGLLVTGGSDGIARVWGDSGNIIAIVGEVVAQLKASEDIVFAAKWNPSGTRLLTDRKSVV